MKRTNAVHLEMNLTDQTIKSNKRKGKKMLFFLHFPNQMFARSWLCFSPLPFYLSSKYCRLQSMKYGSAANSSKYCGPQLMKYGPAQYQCSGSRSESTWFWASRIRVHYSGVWIQIRILLSSKTSKRNLDSYCFMTSFGPFIFEKWCKCTFIK